MNELLAPFSLALGANVHTCVVEFLNVPGEIHDVKFILLANFELTHFEIEPVSVAFGVRVNFHEHVVLVLVLKVH